MGKYWGMVGAYPPGFSESTIGRRMVFRQRGGYDNESSCMDIMSTEETYVWK